MTATHGIITIAALQAGIKKRDQARFTVTS